MGNLALSSQHPLRDLFQLALDRAQRGRELFILALGRTQSGRKLFVLAFSGNVLLKVGELDRCLGIPVVS